MDYDLPASDDDVAPAVKHYIDVRLAIQREGGDWGELADLFTDDCVWSDIAWGRVEGRENVRAFLREAMAGVDTTNPIDFWASDGPRVLIKWRQQFPGSNRTDAHGSSRR